VLNNARLVQEKKLRNLGFQTAAETNDPTKVIFNYSKRHLTDPEKRLLAKGLNLAIPPKSLNYGDFLAPFESLCKQIFKTHPNSLDSSIVDPMKATIKDAAFECLNSYDPKVEQNLTKDEYLALKSLLKDDTIVIQKSDKGNSVVILNKCDYVEGMQSLLSDTSKFKKININQNKDYNHIHNQELKITNELRKLKKNGSMTQETYTQLFPQGTVPSVMYGLSKVHKPVVNNKPKLRPILAAINSSTYNISQYINKLLKPFTSNKFTAKDSF